MERYCFFLFDGGTRKITLLRNKDQGAVARVVIELAYLLDFARFL